ncbi:hypothetical protein PRIPAC_86294 [Pristionchus pacificus]|uniref:Uncharacterized protein n=1 Tax=Pristionchus pacificus TaxID=54126 RepID=A0A2A6BTV0_PRIPA|nr:hypothetical protein PRIPAC_86294 [Pristionchus pacificus]|eukprot:PDM69318.1 hypothetical protein PRIPAC_47620 [Pristionchus pacificus]
MTTDAREKFFEMLRVVAENRYFKDVYAVEFFLSVFEMHRENAEGVITAENMTTAEKESWYAQLLSFMVRKESAILRNLERGRKFSSERLPIRNPSHALHKHPWWRGDFKFTQVIESNYELVD